MIMAQTRALPQWRPAHRRRAARNVAGGETGEASHSDQRLNRVVKESRSRTNRLQMGFCRLLGCRSRFVEEQPIRLLHESSSKGNALLLTGES